MRNFIEAITGAAIFLTVVVVSFGSWLQHFITSINEEMWVLLVLGVVVPPVGMIHGILVWVGVL